MVIAGYVMARRFCFCSFRPLLERNIGQIINGACPMLRKVVGVKVLESCSPVVVHHPVIGRTDDNEQRRQCEANRHVTRVGLSDIPGGDVFLGVWKTQPHLPLASPVTCSLD